MDSVFDKAKDVETNYYSNNKKIPFSKTSKNSIAQQLYVKIYLFPL